MYQRVHMSRLMASNYAYNMSLHTCCLVRSTFCCCLYYFYCTVKLIVVVIIRATRNLATLKLPSLRLTLAGNSRA